MKDILMQIKPKRGSVKYPSFKITHFADFFSLLLLRLMSLLTLMETFILKNKIKGAVIDYAKL